MHSIKFPESAHVIPQEQGKPWFDADVVKPPQDMKCFIARFIDREQMRATYANGHFFRADSFEVIYPTHWRYIPAQ